jgi:uncharacterized protein YjiS (DUF1127 family)
MWERIDTFARLTVTDRAVILASRLWEDFKALAAMALAWQVRARQRNHLARLDDRMLRDVGLSRSDVEREWRKPFWHC